MTFSLRGDSISTDGNARVLITDINPDGSNNEDALICTAEVAITGPVISNLYLDPTEMSTDSEDRIDPGRVSKTM